MKYSQFLEATEILESQGLTFDDVKDKDADELNEIFGINAAIKSAIVDSKLGQALRNSFLTKYGRLSKKFVKIASKLKIDITKQLEKSIQKYTSTKTKNAEKIQTIEATRNPIPDQLLTYNFKIEVQIMRIVNQLTEKLIDIKTEEVFARIEKNKVKRTTLYELKYVWEVIMTETKLSILNDLMERKIISSAKIIKSIQKARKEREEEQVKEFKDLKVKHDAIGKEKEKTGVAPPTDGGGDFTSSEEL